MSIVCTICQDMVTERPQGLSDVEELIILGMSCGHIFHRSCISEWFSKVGNTSGHQSNGNGACPCCKTAVGVAQGLRLYPSGDEEGQALAEKVNNAKKNYEKLQSARGEMEQLKTVMEVMGSDIESERQRLMDELEGLRLDNAMKLSEIDDVRRQLDENLNNQSLEKKNWEVMVGKLNEEKNEAVTKVQAMEKTLSEQEKMYKLRMIEFQSKFETEAMKQEAENNETMILKETIDDLRKQLDNSAVKKSDKSCQTDGRDVSLLRARLVSYKSCQLHMQEEIRKLERELAMEQHMEDDSGAGDSTGVNECLHSCQQSISLFSGSSENDQEKCTFEDSFENDFGFDDEEMHVEQETDGVDGDGPSSPVKTVTIKDEPISHDSDNFVDAPQWALDN